MSQKVAIKRIKPMFGKKGDKYDIVYSRTGGGPGKCSGGYWGKRSRTKRTSHFWGRGGGGGKPP